MTHLLRHSIQLTHLILVLVRSSSISIVLHAA